MLLAGIGLGGGGAIRGHRHDHHPVVGKHHHLYRGASPPVATGADQALQHGILRRDRPLRSAGGWRGGERPSTAALADARQQGIGAPHQLAAPQVGRRAGGQCDRAVLAPIHLAVPQDQLGPAPEVRLPRPAHRQGCGGIEGIGEARGGSGVVAVQQAGILHQQGSRFGPVHQGDPPAEALQTHGLSGCMAAGIQEALVPDLNAAIAHQGDLGLGEFADRFAGGGGEEALVVTVVVGVE